MASILLVAPAATATADVPELCILTAEPHVGQPFVLTVYDNQPNRTGQVSFFDNQIPLGGSALIDGKATVTWTPTAAGVRWISVVKYKDGVQVGGGARQIEVKPATCS
ncbi:Ig-like domain-containing protein [Nocardia sp. CA-151230]|uniref:Ig-like domain-containing protein n=1 Tax=Nocardia sp. CA-151230 TaxID=3239982 RepID=UPI003D921B87